jgi:hypothetical protein
MSSSKQKLGSSQVPCDLFADIQSILLIGHLWHVYSLAFVYFIS